MRDMLTRRLNREGFQSITASNSVQAIALARAERPALILLDIDVPMLNGWQVAQRLRSIPETRTIPIIVLTGSPLPEIDQQFSETGYDAYESKPINFSQLIAKIRWLARPNNDDDGLGKPPSEVVIL
ncbi:MAG: response regulator [Chloroflexales bacterium]|nr:response regulator [Chloroflexales bacterium]